MAKVLTGKSLANGALKSESLPKSLKILNWGVNTTLKGPVIVNDKTVRVFDKNQKKNGSEIIQLDYEHNTVPGTSEFKRTKEPREVAGHFSTRIVPGDGVYIDANDWTDSGKANAKNYMDLSPAPIVDEDGILIGLHSVALTQKGAVEELTFLNCNPDDSVYSMLMTLSLPGKKEGGHDTPPKGYPTSKEDYADPTNYRYPIDTEEHVRAAWSYVHQARNEKGFSADELSAVKERIRKAAVKYGISLDAMSAGELDSNNKNTKTMDQEYMKALRKVMSMEDEPDDGVVMKAFSEAAASGSLKNAPLQSNFKDIAKPSAMSVEAIAPIVEAAIQKIVGPLTLSVTALTAEKAEEKKNADKTARAMIVADGIKEGKVLTLSAEDIEAIPVNTLKSIVAALPKTLNFKRSHIPTVKAGGASRIDTSVPAGCKLVVLNADGTTTPYTPASGGGARQATVDNFNEQLAALRGH